MLITLDLLKRLGACDEGRRAFEVAFPNGYEWTGKNSALLPIRAGLGMYLSFPHIEAMRGLDNYDGEFKPSLHNINILYNTVDRLNVRSMDGNWPFEYLTFRHGTMKDVNFYSFLNREIYITDTDLTDVMFQDCVSVKWTFYRCNMTNVRFRNCKTIESVNIWESTINDSYLLGLETGKQINFKNNHVTGTSIPEWVVKEWWQE